MISPYIIRGGTFVPPCFFIRQYENQSSVFPFRFRFAIFTRQITTMKTVKYCTNPFEAELARTRLLDEGIDARIINEHIGWVAAALPQADNNPQVVVADEDYDRAAALLGTLPSRIVVCPYCGSADTESATKRSAGARIAAILALLTPSGQPRGRYRCRRCHRRFRGAR